MYTISRSDRPCDIYISTIFHPISHHRPFTIPFLILTPAPLAMSSISPALNIDGHALGKSLAAARAQLLATLPLIEKVDEYANTKFGGKWAKLRTPVCSPHVHVTQILIRCSRRPSTTSLKQQTRLKLILRPRSKVSTLHLLYFIRNT
jgi:hypothetical protein